MREQHLSVMSSEVGAAFANFHCSIFVDATVGAGGHSHAILQSHPEIDLLIGIDRDPSALELAARRLSPWSSKVSLLQGNFADITTLLHGCQVESVEGVLLDLGVSSMQLDQPHKGFSFQREGPLDMRMDPSHSLTAREIVNSWPEEQLGKIFREYGEERQWKAAARAIARSRLIAPIDTTMELVEALRPALGWKQQPKRHFATLVFQALRIAVNDELEALKSALQQVIQLLSPGGRLAVISFHSLEDRLVKNAFRQAAADKEETSGLAGLFRDKTPVVDLVTKRPIVATDAEIALNPRSRSAKLRVLHKR